MNSPDKKINILFITSLLDRMGGAEKNLCDIVLHLNRDEFTPFVLAFKGGELTVMLAGQNIAVMENGIQQLFSIDTLKKGYSLWKFIRTEHIDVVVTYHHDADIFGSIVARLASVSQIITSRRDMGYQLEKKHVLFYRWFGWLFSHFITVSDAVKQEVMAREGVKEHKITTIHNGLELERFGSWDQHKIQRLRDELSLDPDRVTIGMVASFRPIKGQMYLVEAVAAMKEWQHKIQVVIVGYNDTDYFREVQFRIQELGLEQNFIFTGARADVPDLLGLFDIFVISSVNEGFSNAIVEAMAAGLPVVAADSGGNREAVEHGKTGLLFQPCKSRTLAEALTTLLGDAQRMKEFGDKGKRCVAEKFTLHQMIAANEAVYRWS